MKSKEYCGLVRRGAAEPLSKLVADRTIKLSVTLISTTVLEVLVYGCRTSANATGEMLLDQDCYLQQPDSFDDSMTYFNPQCLVREDDDFVSIWENVKVEAGIRAANLNVGEKSKVAELLDSASGPTVFESVQVSEMLQTTLKE